MEPEPEKPHPSEFLEFLSIGPHGKKKVQVDAADTIVNPLGNSQTTLPIIDLDNDMFDSFSDEVPGDAKAGANAEHKMTFMNGVRLYPKAIAWSALLSATIVMEGYDTNLIGSFFAFPIFRQSYGTELSDHTYQISPAWQTGLPNGANVGEIIGLLLNGLFTDRFGYRKTVMGALIWLCVFVTLAFVGLNIEMLMASAILCGLPWGVFQTLSTTYASDVMPLALRAYLTSNVNMCWLIGQLISAGIIRGLIEQNSVWSYRIPFALQWAFALPLVVGVFFAPESPWWLIRHGKVEEAKRSLLRLTQKNQPGFNADETVAMMKHTNEVEKHLKAGTTYLDCFRGNDLRRTEIATMVWITQALCGGPMIGYAAYFYEQAGFDTERSFELTLGMYALGITGNIISWILMRRVGRRTLYMSGMAGCIVILIVVGAISCLTDSPSIAWALGSLIIILTFTFNCTVGPVCYSLVAEIPSTRLRVKTVVIARVMYNVTCIITNILAARMLNPTAWNWKGKTAFVFAGATLLCLVWCHFRLPEPMGLTYLELDILFEKKAKTRKFKKFQSHLAETGYFSMTRQDSTAFDWRGYG